MEVTVKKRRQAHIDQAHCVACGCCVKVCPRQALHIWRGIVAQVDTERCVGCGLCARECPASVISIKEATA